MNDNPIYQPSRIILAIETRLLREMLERAVARSPFLEVVGTVGHDTDLSTAVKQNRVDWVFVSLQPDGKLPRAAESLLVSQPSVSIIAVAPDGSRLVLGWTEPCDSVIAKGRDGSPVRLHWTESHQKTLTDLSLGELISVVRKGALWELAIHDVEGISDVERLLSGKKVAILVAEGIELRRLTRLLQALCNTGAKPVIISSSADEQMKGRGFEDWDAGFQAEVPLTSANAADYDGLLLPGGMKDSEPLRTDEDAIKFVKAFDQMGKPIATTCCGARLLLEAGIVKGKRLTSCEALRTDLQNAGAEWISKVTVVDNGLVTSHSPDNIAEFNRSMIEVFARS
jgi:protease I